MPYAALTHVQARDKGRTFDQTSKPAATEVAGYLDQKAGEIDSVLRARGYALPIATGATSALKYLEDLNTTGAICLVEQSAVTGAGKKTDWCKMYSDALVMLSAGKVELDAVRDIAQGIPRHREQATAMFTRLLEY
jgi:hypothetical protein